MKNTTREEAEVLERYMIDSADRTLLEQDIRHIEHEESIYVTVELEKTNVKPYGDMRLCDRNETSSEIP